MTAKKHLDALSRFTERRNRTITKLEQEELDLIEAAKGAGASWARIAEALGLRSRQRAQQRHGELASTHPQTTTQEDE